MSAQVGRFLSLIAAVVAGLLGGTLVSPAPSSASISAAPCPDGQLLGEYFNNRSLSGTPVFTRCEGGINYTWGSDSPGSGVGANNFSVRWTGRFFFSAGNHTFTAVADDGVRVLLDGDPVIDAWRDQGPTRYAGSRSLGSGGEREVKVEYYEAGGGATIQVGWTGSSTSAPTDSAASEPVAGAAALASCLTGSTGTSQGPPGAYELSPGRKNELQSALDTYKVVRLLPGDYHYDYHTGGLHEVTLKSGQQLYGLPGEAVTRIPRVIVPGGTTGAVLSGVHAGQLDFPPSGAVTRGNCFTNVWPNIVSVKDATLEDNLFLYIVGQFIIDTSGGGHLKNNRFIKVRGNQWNRDVPPLTMRGDGARKSSGNVWLLHSCIFPARGCYYFDNQSDVTLLGAGGEMWNFAAGNDSRAAEPMLKTGAMGSLRLFHPSGGQNGFGQGSPYRTSMFDVTADETIVYPYETTGSGDPVFAYRGANRRSALLNVFPDPSTGDGASGSVRFKAFQGSEDAFVNGNSVTNTALNSGQQDALRQMFVNSSSRIGVPWERPVFGPINDPAGGNWQQDLASRPDSADYIQNLINTQGVARLPAGRYYISRPLRLKTNQGIVGSGEGNTAIIAKDPNIDLIVGDEHHSSWTGTKFVLTDLTLQGGRNGIHHEPGGSGAGAQYTHVVLSHVTFRNMSEAGIFVDRIGGWDTMWLEHLTFYRNAVGVKQRASRFQYNEMPEQAYMDGVTFFHSQFVENGKAIELIAERVNVQASWINCRFEGNGLVAELQNNIGPIFVNSDFVNNDGRPTIVNRTSAWGTPWVEFVNAYFRADARGQAMLPNHAVCDGCVFERGSSAGATMLAGPGSVFLYNSRSADMPLGGTATGLFLNSRVPGDSRLSEQGVLLRNGALYPFLSGAADPVPRLLTGSVFR